jgi:hypothetical protein
MNRTSHAFTRLAVLATTVLVLVLATAGLATARTCVDPSEASLVPCPTRFGRGYDGPSTTSVQQVTSNSDRTLQWVLFAAAIVGALAIVAVAADVLGRRRWRRPPLDEALESTDPDELPRAAGLLGDLFARQSHPGAAEHAYRAAIDVDDQYWSPIAQVALADLLSDRGERAEAQALLEAAIASGHARAVPAAQTSLSHLWTGASHTQTVGTLPKSYETLEDAKSARRSPVVSTRGPAAKHPVCRLPANPPGPTSGTSTTRPRPRS